MEGLPVWYGEVQKQAAHLVPEIEHALLVLARLLEQRAAMLLYLVNQEGKHDERCKDVRQVIVSMPESMLEVVCVPQFQCLKRLVLNGPSAAATPHDGHHRIPVKREVGDPRKPLCLTLSIGLLILQHVDLQVEVRIIERQVAVPREAVHCAVPVLLLLCLLRIAGREPIEQHLVIVGLRAKDKPKVLLSQSFFFVPSSFRIDSGASGNTSFMSGWTIAALRA